MKKVSISDIARKAGVSVSTVSFVMNDKAVKMRISQEVIRRVENIAKEMGYRPNQLARGLRTGKTRTIGLIVENISNAFYASLAKTIEDEAKKYDYKVVYCSTDNDEEKARELINMLSQRQVDGYIITPTLNLLDDIRRLQAENKPVVLVDRYFPPHDDIPYVLVDNYQGVTDGMDYLIGKGYRKIALITIEVTMAHMKDRLDAYYDALRRNRINLNEELVKLIPYGCVRETALQEIKELLAGKRADIDAVFFLTNYLGVLGIEAFKALRIRIPDDMAVLCFDDNDIFRLYTPTISVIRQPIAEIGQRAMLALIERLQHAGAESGPGNRNIKVPAELVPRESI
ncbi:MAG: LacI family DNA-binding transcriptional regulator [Bacteroidota bacterium]|nr:LacI family DNA-binding transcriptional regulator [Bacteroidota bacterium]MDP4216345.1 LacI family DNA-binding transcriptional regulator [Bacteroidota bacterium]MDP4246836.1 LacI family DNA-binding transcriptional regulator [Bacteroidota bacterium]MDP4257196.1 LacI family DNA-binding transcriptional regulator [Bacteroidota bacterium]